MIIRKLQVENFRNLKRVEVEPDAVLNQLYGSNGAGKTSVLESVVVRSRGRSFRTAQAAELIGPEDRTFPVFALTEDRHGQLHRLGLERSGKRWRGRKDGADLSQLSLLSRALPLVLMEPDSHLSVSGPPEVRRKFLDWGAFDVEHEFLTVWRRYSKVLKQRNAALRGGETAVLDSIEKVLASEGGRLQRIAARALRFGRRQHTGHVVRTERRADEHYVGVPAGLVRRRAPGNLATNPVMQATPVTWRGLLTAGWHGRTGMKVLCGDEALDPALAAQLLGTGASLWNMYGPTETTIWSTCGEIRDPGRISVGWPIDNTRLHVLDERLRPVPAGLPGELCIGGDGVAQGSHERPELTAQRFIPDPFGSGTKLYRTGYRARFLADGRLQVLGRLDGQVKVRGFRIELGEVEAVLARCAGVESCAVAVREVSGGDRRLVAWVVGREGSKPAKADLREALRKELPDYMIPSAFVLLERLPLTGNGKVDRRALPDPQWGVGWLSRASS